jgi:hypothetical protein
MEVKRVTLLMGLRGPDVWTPELQVIKTSITGRMRHIVGITHNPYGPCVTEHVMDSQELESLKEALKALAEWTETQIKSKNPLAPQVVRAVEHYLDHTMGALVYHKAHPVWGGHAQKILAEITLCMDIISLAVVVDKIGN